MNLKKIKFFLGNSLYDSFFLKKLSLNHDKGKALNECWFFYWINKNFYPFQEEKKYLNSFVNIWWLRWVRKKFFKLQQDLSKPFQEWKFTWIKNLTLWYIVSFSTTFLGIWSYHINLSHLRKKNFFFNPKKFILKGKKKKFFKIKRKFERKLNENFKKLLKRKFERKLNEKVKKLLKQKFERKLKKKLKIFKSKYINSSRAKLGSIISEHISKRFWKRTYNLNFLKHLKNKIKLFWPYKIRKKTFKWIHEEENFFPIKSLFYAWSIICSTNITYVLTYSKNNYIDYNSVILLKFFIKKYSYIRSWPLLNVLNQKKKIDFFFLQYIKKLITNFLNFFEKSEFYISTELLHMYKEIFQFNWTKLSIEVIFFFWKIIFSISC